MTASIEWDEYMDVMKECNDLHARVTDLEQQVHDLETEKFELQGQLDAIDNYGKMLKLPRDRMKIPEIPLPSDVIEVFVDGSGHGGYAALFPGSQHVGHLPEGATHNEAEFHALLLALKNMESDKKYLVKSDSNLIVHQVNKSWRINEPRLLIIAQECWMLMAHLHVRVIWIPREQNLADALLR